MKSTWNANTLQTVQKARSLLQQYIIEPQRWNRYTYALNNPLKYIDPDGWEDEVYSITLLGEDFKVTISDKITDEAVRAEIKKKIQDAADKLNKGYEDKKLTEKEIKQIRSLNGNKSPRNLEGKPKQNRPVGVIPLYLRRNEWVQASSSLLLRSFTSHIIQSSGTITAIMQKGLREGQAPSP